MRKTTTPIESAAEEDLAAYVGTGIKIGTLGSEPSIIALVAERADGPGIGFQFTYTEAREFAHALLDLVNQMEPLS